jgi:3-hydroxybutyryl-CoA dehydrogenase
LEVARRRGRLDADECGLVLSRIEFVSGRRALADRDLVLETRRGTEEERCALFTILDRTHENEAAILATNASTLPIIKLAMATTRPANVLGLHFFDPAPVVPLVEVVSSIVTSPESMRRVASYATNVLRKSVIQSPDRAGFVVHALLVPYVIAAIRMLESGHASADDIDAGMVTGCSHPLGPLALADLIGLDKIKEVADSMYAETRQPLYASPPLLNRMVEADHLGRKRGKGFFDYPGEVGRNAQES